MKVTFGFSRKSKIYTNLSLISSKTCWSITSNTLIIHWTDLLNTPTANLSHIPSTYIWPVLFNLLIIHFTDLFITPTSHLSLIPSMDVMISPSYLLIIHFTDLLIMPSAVASVILFSLKMGICSPMALKSPIIVAILRPCLPTAFPEKSPSDILKLLLAFLYNLSYSKDFSESCNRISVPAFLLSHWGCPRRLSEQGSQATYGLTF